VSHDDFPMSDFITRSYTATGRALTREEKMSLEAKLRKRVEQLLSSPDEHGVAGPRLLVEARRLWAHVQKWTDQHLVTPSNPAAMEIGCHAMYLPMKRMSAVTVGKFGQLSLRERAEQAAEELVSEMADHMDEASLDAAVQLLNELPQRKPASDDARLLADVINVEDFGVNGVIAQAIILAAKGQGLDQLVEAADKRDAYGYFEARLKDGFHFGPLRELARRRVARARQMVELLKQESLEI